MRLGVGLPSKTTPGKTITGDRFRRFVERADAHGFAGLWTLEHLVRPPSYRTSFGDPLATLAAAAGIAPTRDVGTSILVLPMRNPVLVAKRAATIQRLSAGRLTLGVGQGYVEAEYEAVGVPFEERSRRFSEGVELLARLLREETVSFDGEFYQVEEFRLEPTLDRPPRLLVAGGGRERDGKWRVARGVKERMRHADGWIASSGASLAKDWADIAGFLDNEGIDPRTFEKVGLQHIHLDPGTDGEAVKRRQYAVFDGFIGEERGFEYVEENFLVGTEATIHERLETYDSEGFDELILHPAATESGELDRQLDLWADRLLPAYS